MKKIFLLGVALCYFNIVFSQNIIQDNKGSTSLSLNPGESSKTELVDFNTALLKLSSSEKKLEANYYQFFNTNHPTFIGASASGELKNSVSSLFKTGDVAAGSNIKLRAGYRLDKTDNSFRDWFDNFIRTNGRTPTDQEMRAQIDGMSAANDLWLVTNIEFTGTKFKLFHPDSAFDSQIEKIDFTALEFDIGFNYWHANILETTFLFGATIGAKKSNNLDDLAESTQEIVTTRINKGDTVTRKVTKKNVVFHGEYKESMLFPLKLDVYFKPIILKNISFLLFSRVDISKVSKPTTKMGVGVYFLRKNNMFDPIFGVNVDYKDVFNVNPSSDLKSDAAKLSVGLVARLGLLNSQK